jgi:nicotinate-nucleotide adenylyltransferase
MTGPVHRPRRIGVFGGTFDPIHLGHLILAEQSREAGRLDEVWFVPAGNPPHKQDHTVTPFEKRVEMIALAIAGNPAFRLDPVEKDLPGLTYTANTLAALHERHPGDDLFLLIGSDTLAELPLWYQPRKVIESAGLLVMLRAGHAAMSPGELLAALKLPGDFPLHLEFVTSPPLIDISSRDLRHRLVERRSIRYLVPRAVECYIGEKQLYRSPGERGQ